MTDMNDDHQAGFSRETIYAPASAPGRAGVAVIRVSGPAASQVLHRLSGCVPAPRMATLRVLRDPATGTVIDRALILYFKGPASFTGEDVAEFHLHGGRAVVDGFLTACGSIPGLRLANPGEFTRRAFENGRLDLTEAEAIADLVDAQTALQKDQALAQMGGALRDLYQDWAARLLKALAHIEAFIDFPDEDLPPSFNASTQDTLRCIRDAIEDHLADNRKGEILREGLHIAVLGAPNAGKSSLVNALNQRDVAIISAMAGTTRDVIETHLDLGGYPVILADTAGLRTIEDNDPDKSQTVSHDSIENEGIRRAKTRAQEADLKILLYDMTTAKDQATRALEDDQALIVYNKIDLYRGDVLPQDGIGISARTGQGIPALTETIIRKIEAALGDRTRLSPTRLRHREALLAASASLSRALAAPLPELMAEDMRLATRSLGRITGRVDVEDVLDMIFRDFCIGK
jgi:tRNA modification GTPase